MSEFQITKKSVDYSTQKSAKWWVYLIRGTFDIYNATIWSWGLTGSTAKVLTDVHEIFWQKLCRKSKSPKIPWTTAHENRENWGSPPLGHIWPSKWDVLAEWANWIHSCGLNGRPRLILTKIMSEFQITKKSIDYSTRKSAKLKGFLLWATLDL